MQKYILRRSTMEKLYRKIGIEMENAILKRDLMLLKKSSLLTLENCLKVLV